VDPANPLPVEYVEELVKRSIIKAESSSEAVTLSYECGNPAEGPHAIGEIVDVWVVEAKDSYHKPTQPYVSDTHAGLNRFESSFGVDMDIAFMGGLWDASDASDDVSSQLLSLTRHMSWLIEDENDIVIGWVDYPTANGKTFS
jgi:hypothetical protein